MGIDFPISLIICRSTRQRSRCYRTREPEIHETVLRIRESGSVLFLPLNPRSFSREIRNSYFGLRILKFFDADPDPGSCKPGIRDGKNQIRSRIYNTA
jgi:hypothetical protein